MNCLIKIYSFKIIRFYIDGFLLTCFSFFCKTKQNIFCIIRDSHHDLQLSFEFYFCIFALYFSCHMKKLCLLYSEFIKKKTYQKWQFYFNTEEYILVARVNVQAHDLKEGRFKEARFLLLASSPRRL